MSDTQTRTDHRYDRCTDFRHEALFYGGAYDFLEGTGAFIQGALDAGEPIMVALLPDRLDLLRRHLGPDAERVEFVDVAELGRNPGRIIPAWRWFVDRNRDAPSLRGICEPIWAARSEAELTECQRHESLLNDAFAGYRPWWLLCPYDVESLSPEVLDAARRSHPFVAEQGVSRPSPCYGTSSWIFDGELPQPAAVAGALEFDGASLRDVRVAVSAWAAGILPAGRAADLVLAAHEVATNSVLHGGGSGRVGYWQDATTAVAEVRDKGHIEGLLVGRELPSLDDEMGRGLWLAHQLCDLVQVRSSSDGTVVRLHVGRV
jgi:anti-sigma regulatory factor (Ser/Thr protein kinase)